MCNERPPQKRKKTSKSTVSSQQPADTSHNDLKKKYESLQKDYKRVGQAFQNQQEQNQELTALLEECEKEAEELANLVRNKDEVIKKVDSRELDLVLRDQEVKSVRDLEVVCRKRLRRYIPVMSNMRREGQLLPMKFEARFYE